jgi:predicted nucleic acid-binding protein
MRYVLDASIGVKWVINEVDSPKALRLRDDYRNGVHDLIAPASFPLEVAHALTKAQRQGIVPDARRLWAEGMIDAPVLVPSMPLMLRALAIATQARIGVYDCIYVAAAEAEGCDLATADTRLLNSLQTTYPFIIALASVP